MFHFVYTFVLIHLCAFISQTEFSIVFCIVRVMKNLGNIDFHNLLQMTSISFFVAEITACLLLSIQDSKSLDMFLFSC